jgi:hypothetical protein
VAESRLNRASGRLCKNVINARECWLSKETYDWSIFGYFDNSRANGRVRTPGCRDRQDSTDRTGRTETTSWRAESNAVGAMQYRTTELELAAFLKARGHRLLGATPMGRLVSFAFGDATATDVASYIAGAEISARELFEAHRGLRALIQQVKQHHTNRTEPTINEHRI